MIGRQDPLYEKPEILFNVLDKYGYYFIRSINENLIIKKITQIIVQNVHLLMFFGQRTQ